MSKISRYFITKLYQNIPTLWHMRQNLQNENLLFGIKLGLAAGAVYYISEQGVWKSSDETIKLCNKITTNVSPYTKEITKQIPVELPSLPKTDDVSFVVQHYWNKGVFSTFTFLANVPSYVGEWTNKGVDALMDNSEIKNLFQNAVDTTEAKK